MPALFPIMLEVEESRVGAVLRLLKDYPGVAKLHLDLDGVGKKVGRRTSESTSANGSGNDHASSRDPDRPQLKTIIIGEMLSGQKNLDHLVAKVMEFWPDTSKGSVGQTLYALKKQKIVSKIGVGVYDLTPEARAKMQAHTVEQPTPGVPQLTAPAKHNRSDTKPWVLTQITDGLSRNEMRIKGEPLGINERMIDGGLTRLKAEKTILPSGEPGRFKLNPAKKPKS